MQPLGDALPAGPADIAEGFRTLDLRLQRSVGHRLFTVLVLNWEANENQRCYSSRPDAYPLSSPKPIDRNGLVFKHTVALGQPLISPDREACRKAFFDHELIASLGCESAVNVPVVWDGQVLGTLNLLHQAGWYREDMLPVLAEHAAWAAPLVRQFIAAWPASSSLKDPQSPQGLQQGNRP